MEKNENATREELLQHLHKPESYVVNDKQLSKMIERYLKNDSFEKLFIFGHGGFGKTEITQRVSKKCEIPVQKFSLDDVRAGLKDIQPNSLIEIECSIQDLGDSYKEILGLSFPNKTIVEVTVEYEGFPRNFILDNPNTFFWVYYRETAEDCLAYMKETGCNPIKIDRMTQNPAAMFEQQTAEIKMFLASVYKFDVLITQIQNGDAEYLDERIMDCMQNIIISTISDDLVKNMADKLNGTLFANKDKFSNKELILKLGIILSRDLPLVSHLYREIK